METWYLLSIITQAYLGPMSMEDCAAAQRAGRLASYGIVCQQVAAFYACEVPDHPGTVQSCPMFAPQPHVTVKP